MLEQFEAAILRDDGTALEKAIANKQAVGNPVYRELAKVYSQLAQGRVLISLRKAFQATGLRDNGEPRLAIANAAAKWVWYEYYGGDIGVSRRPAVRFVSDLREQPGSVPRHRRAVSWFSACRVDREFFFSKSPRFALRARVPLVPAEHLPEGRLGSFHILWEADWEHIPVDPILLRRVTFDLFAVVAEWNLTPVEQLVLEAAVLTRG